METNRIEKFNNYGTCPKLHKASAIARRTDNKLCSILLRKKLQKKTELQYSGKYL